MAIFKPGAIVGGISGIAGGALFKNRRGSPSIGKIPTKPSGTSKAQINTRALYVRAAKAWRGLTTDEQIAWNRAALLRPRRNRLGVTTHPSGFSLYTAFSVQLLMASVTPPALPPPASATVSPGTITLYADTSPEVYVTPEYSGVFGVDFVLLYGARSFSTSPPAIYRGWKFLAAWPETEGYTQYDITLQFYAFLGAPKLGEWVSARAIRVSDTHWPSNTLSATIATVAP